MIHPRLSRLLQPPPARRQVITIIISYFENHKDHLKCPQLSFQVSQQSVDISFPPATPTPAEVRSSLSSGGPNFQKSFSQTPLLVAALCLALLAAVMGLACARYCSSACISGILLKQTWVKLEKCVALVLSKVTGKQNCPKPRQAKPRLFDLKPM